MEQSYIIHVPGIGPVNMPRVDDANFFTIEGVGPVTLEHNLGYVPHIYPMYVGETPSLLYGASATDITEQTAKIVAEPDYKWMALVEKRSKPAIEGKEV